MACTDLCLKKWVQLSMFVECKAMYSVRKQKEKETNKQKSFLTYTLSSSFLVISGPSEE